MRLIEADKVKQAMKKYWKAQVDKALALIDGNEANKRINSYLEHNHELLKAIDELPSVQPEIIRCKDCKYYKYGICMKIGANKSFHGFCDWAERREDGRLNQ